MRPFGLILSFAPLATFADVKFTSPAAGAQIAAGTINVQWQESGISPPIQDLTAYTLVLMVGGNDDGDMLALTTFTSQGTFAAGNEATGTIPSGIAGPVSNGFFFKIESSATNGGVVINYSDRFTITGLTGTTDETYRNAVAALDGSTKGPPSVGDAAPSSTSSAVPSSTTATSRTPTSMMTITQSSTATSTLSHAPGSRNDSGGLPSGVLAGIAIAGVAVGLLGLAFGLWMCLRRKRRRDSGSVRMDVDNSDLPGEVFRKEMTVTTPPVELDPYARIVEADHGTPPAEMDGMNVRVELEGDSTHMPDRPRPDSMLTEVPQTPISPMTLGTSTIGTGTWDSIRMPLPDPTPTAPGRPVTPKSNV